jgi:hypothetical protein
MNATLIVFTTIISICLILFVSFIRNVYKYVIRLLYIKNFTSYISVLDYHMDKAYDMVHKDRILAYSLDAYRVPDNEYEAISQDFVRLVQKYIGPTLLIEFVNLYGDEESFLFIMLEYFSRRYEEDEIRKSAMDNLTKEE